MGLEALVEQEAIQDRQDAQYMQDLPVPVVPPEVDIKVASLAHLAHQDDLDLLDILQVYLIVIQEMVATDPLGMRVTSP